MRSSENGTALDLSGRLNAQTFIGVTGLGTTLAADPALSACLVKRLYAYGAGHTPDEQVNWLDPLRQRREASGLRIRDLLREMALNEAFYRIPPEPATVDVKSADNRMEKPHGN